MTKAMISWPSITVAWALLIPGPALHRLIEDETARYRDVVTRARISVD